MPWRWGPPNRGIRASVSYASPPYSGRRVFVAFIDTASPALANLVVPLFLIAPPYQSSRWGDFFLPPHHHVMPVPACLPRRRMSLSSARAGVLRSFFRRFHMGPFACSLRRVSSALPLHGTPSRDAIVPIAPSIDTPGGEGCSLPLRCLSCPHAVV